MRICSFEFSELLLWKSRRGKRRSRVCESLFDLVPIDWQLWHSTIRILVSIRIYATINKVLLKIPVVWAGACRVRSVRGGSGPGGGCRFLFRNARIGSG